ncbi:hypothetical protein KSF73_09190 [Burkholderiaceae bacterium DAT-1]|nr:hypothetical protein [Burkholderiaceae bacterium DAT-1]
MLNVQENEYESGCRHLSIASNAAGKVIVCTECGRVHVAMPHVMLNLDPDDFDALSALLNTARPRIEELARIRLSCHREAGASAYRRAH